MWDHSPQISGNGQGGRHGRGVGYKWDGIETDKNPESVIPDRKHRVPSSLPTVISLCLLGFT